MFSPEWRAGYQPAEDTPLYKRSASGQLSPWAYLRPLFEPRDKITISVNRIRETVSFEVGKEVEKGGFRLVISVGQRKTYESPRGIEP